MGVRTVRLDDEAEKALQEVMAATGLSASAVLKQGLENLRRQIDVRQQVATEQQTPVAPQHTLREAAVAYETKTAFSIYEKLDLGPGGYAGTPSTNVKEGVKDAIRKKLGR